MKNYLKTIVALGFAGAFLFGCASSSANKAEYGVRYEAHQKLLKFGEAYYKDQCAVPAGDEIITAEWGFSALEIKIENTKTGNTLKMIDRKPEPGFFQKLSKDPYALMPFDGIDVLIENGIYRDVAKIDKNSSKYKALEEKLDDALLKILSHIEKRL